MRILMIAPEPVLEPRGTPISVFQRLSGLSTLGHSVDLATYHLGETISIPRVTVHRTPRLPFIRQIRVGPSWSKILLDLLLLGLAVKMLMTNRYDAIHSHEEAGFFSTALAILFRTRHLYDMHSSLPRQLVNYNFGAYRPLIKLFEWLEQWTINGCDAVITVGPDLERHVNKINATVPQIVIENLPVRAGEEGCRSRAHQLRAELGLQDKQVVVYTGNFERYQGVKLLLESARILQEHHLNITFILVGGRCDQVAFWQEQAEARGVKSQFRFVGAVPVTDVRDYLEMADILVSPRTEGLSIPLKIYSYLQAGKPIVATNIAAHTPVLSSETALLVDPTAEGLAEGFLRLNADPALRQQLSSQAQAVAEQKYSDEGYLSRLASIYGELAAAVTSMKHPVRIVEG